MKAEDVMNRQSLRRGWMVGAVALSLLVPAASAFAQGQGQLRGVVLDTAGKPVPDAEITLEYVGDVQITVNTKTNARGEFTRVGMRTGQWKMTATKDKLVGKQTVNVVIAQMTKVADLVIKEPVATTGGAVDTSGMTAKEREERNKLMAAMQAEFAAADALLAATPTDPEGAIAKYTIVAGQVPNCAICYHKIGEAYAKKDDNSKAEESYKKAIELDPKLPDPYSALAVLYNSQKKFDEATKMSEKVNELLAGSATGGNAAAVFNQGIIYWNQGGKAAEAKAQFVKAIALDPQMADAHYWLGMANLNLGLIPDAAKAFEEYLKVAPTGQHAETVKGILKTIK
jgi:cytochrome c-type biogenesis protein CcmH/NrfG